MRGWWRVMVAGATLAAGLAALAYPYPTFYGDTGLVMAPTADVKPVANFQLGVQAVKLREPNQVEQLYPIRLVYGAEGDGEFALFLAESPERRGHGRDIWGAAGKVQLMCENLDGGLPSVAVGGRYLQDKREVTCGETSAYLVISKSLFYHRERRTYWDDPYRVDRDPFFCAKDGHNYPFAVRLHAGLMYSNLSESTQREADFLYPFGGLSFTNGKGTEAAIDYFPKLEKYGCVFRKPAVSGVVRLRASDSLALEVGATRPYLRGCEVSPFVGLIYIYDPDRDRGHKRGCGCCW